MGRRSGRAGLAVVGAVIGAGFASGREIDAFFAAYGRWGLAGVLAAAGVLTWLLDRTTEMPRGRLWRWLFGMMTAVTGGAMLACSGEIAALVLPLRGAYALGVGCALAFAMTMRGRGGVLAGLGGVLTAVLVGMLALGLRGGAGGTVLGAGGGPGRALAAGVCYGGLNAALALPVVTGPMMRDRPRRRAVLTAGALLLVLLGMGWAVLMRNPQVRGEATPLIHLMARYGHVGRLVCVLTMEAAVLTTLLACASGLAEMLPRRWAGMWPVLMLAAAAAGFRGLVGRAYPALGAGCFALLAGRAVLRVGRTAGQSLEIGRN